MRTSVPQLLKLSARYKQSLTSRSSSFLIPATRMTRTFLSYLGEGKAEVGCGDKLSIESTHIFHQESAPLEAKAKRNTVGHRQLEQLSLVLLHKLSRKRSRPIPLARGCRLSLSYTSSSSFVQLVQLLVCGPTWLSTSNSVPTRPFVC